MPLRQLLAGRRFGRWLAISEETDQTKAHTVLCKCDCGTTRSVLAANLKTGRSQSCGCLKSETISRKMRKFWSVPRNRYGELK